MAGWKNFGQGIADEMEIRRNELPGKPGATFSNPVRNRRDSFEYHADRILIHCEFLKLWEHQRATAVNWRILTDLKLKLDDPAADEVWLQRSRVRTAPDLLGCGNNWAMRSEPTDFVVRWRICTLRNFVFSKP